MKKIRLIARLDKGENVVKGICFEGLRIMITLDLAKVYYQDGIDELIYLDTVASLYQRNNLLDVIKIHPKNIFVPITVGGGIRSIDDAKSLLMSGADKVAINTVIVKDKQLINKFANEIGSMN